MLEALLFVLLVPLILLVTILSYFIWKLLTVLEENERFNLNEDEEDVN